MGRRTSTAAAAGLAAIAFAAVPASASADQVAGLAVNGVSPANLFSIEAKGKSGILWFIDHGDNAKQTRGRVVCLSAEGNRAFVVYRDIRKTPPTPGTAGGTVLLEDNGPATSAGPVDEMANGRATRRRINRLINNGCPVPAGGTTNPIESGEIIVRDTDPPPSSSI